MVRKIGKASGKSPATTSATRSATRSRALGLMSALGRGGAGVKLLDPGADRRVRILPTGVDSLDVAIGAGGYPIGRMTILHGGESCIAGGAFVLYLVRDAAGKQINGKGGSLARLWQRFHGIPDPHLHGTAGSMPPPGATFEAPSVNDEGRIVHSRIVDVVKTGEKPCFAVVTRGGLRIEATADHRFLTEAGYTALADLQIGQAVCVHTNVPFRKAPEDRAKPQGHDRKFLYLTGKHPVAGVKVVAGKYTYSRLARARAVVEARMNGLDLDRYVARLNAGDLDGLQFLDRDLHVHHLDEDHLNDDPANLVVLTPTDHGVLHATERHNDLRFMVIPDEIVAIDPVGPRMTYDVKLAGPWHNFVANKFAVHNCGKTTVSLVGCAEVQRRDRVAIYVDCEHKLDLAYSETLGVDVESLVLVYPDSIEKCFKQLSKILRILRGLPAKKAKKGRFDRGSDDDDDDDVDVPVDESAMAGLAGDDFPIMIVLDSFQSLAAQRTFDAAYDQEGFNPESFAWSRVLRKFIPEIDDMQAVLLGISQVRVDLASGGFGPKKEKVAVGKAPGHHATIIIKWTGRKKVGSLRKGVTGELHELLIAKNQIGNPYRTASLPIVFGKGVDKIASTMAAAQATGALRAAKGKGSYTLDLASGAGADVVIKGQAGLQDLADHDPAMFAALRAEIRSRMGKADLVPTAAPTDDAESLDED